MRFLSLTNNKIGKIIDYIESDRIPFIYYIFTIISVFYLRHLLEIIAYDQPVNLHQFFHYNLFFAAVFLPTTIILTVLTAKKLKRVAKSVMALSTLIFLAPLIDMIIYGINNYQTRYLLPQDHSGTTHLLLRFIGFFFFEKTGDPKIGVSYGIQIEIAIILIMIVVYCLHKNSSIFKSIGATLLVYSSIFLTGMAPYFLLILRRIIGENSLIFSDLEISNFFLILVFVYFWIVFYLADKKSFIALIKDLRIFRLLHYSLMIVLGIALGLRTGSYTISFKSVHYLELINLFCTLFFACLTVIFFNNLSDYSIDKISNKKRPLVSGEISPNIYKNLTLIFLTMTVLFTIKTGAGFIPHLFLILFIGNYFLYSSPPVRFKKVPVLSKLTISINSLLLLTLGYSYVVKPRDIISAPYADLALPLPLIWIFLTIFTLGANFIDLKDYAGDRVEGIMTLPVLLGLKNAKLISGLFFAGAIASAYFIIDMAVEMTTGESYVLIGIIAFFALLEFFLINRKRYSEKPVFIVYLTFLTGLIITIFYL